MKLYSYKAKRPETNTKATSYDKYNERHYGVMADEICHVFPECIGRSKFRRYKPRPEKLKDETDETYFTRCPLECESQITMVEYGRFNLLNIRAIQALTNENEALKAEVVDLKARLERIENILLKNNKKDNVNTNIGFDKWIERLK